MNSVTQRQSLPPQASSHSSQSPRCPCDSTVVSTETNPISIRAFRATGTRALCLSSTLLTHPGTTEYSPSACYFQKAPLMHRHPCGDLTCSAGGFNKATWLTNIQPPLQAGTVCVPGTEHGRIYTHATKNTSTVVEDYYIAQANGAQESKRACMFNDRPGCALKT